MASRKSRQTHFARLAKRLWSDKRHNAELCYYRCYTQLSRIPNSSLWEWGYVLNPEDASTSYGDWHRIKSEHELEEVLKDGNTIAFFVPYCSGSDYSGSTVEQSNYRSFLREFSEVSGVFSAYGDYGTYAVLVDPRILFLPSNEPIVETIKGLENYPVLDESDLSEREMEATNESWECWGNFDTIRYLRDNFGDEFSELRFKDDSAESYAVFGWLMEHAEKQNQYWEPDGGGMHICIERCLEDISISDIAELVKSIRQAREDRELPLCNAIMRL